MASHEDQRYTEGPTFNTTERVQTIPMRDGYSSEIRIFSPPTPKADADGKGSPLVVLFFGGGFISGSNKQLVPLARAAAGLYGATAVTASYRLAPEHKFPVAANDAWDSVCWLGAHAAEFGADTGAGFVIGGVSAGGGLSVVTAQRAIREKLPAAITGVWACIPVTLDERNVPEKYRETWVSREQNADALLLSKESIDHVQKMYEPDGLSEAYSPFNSAVGFAELPRTYVQVCGMDPLRDDGLIYERALRDAGVETMLDVYPGVPHGHFGAFPGIQASVKYRKDTVGKMGWLLRREADKEVLKEMEGAVGGANPAAPEAVGS